MNTISVHLTDGQAKRLERLAGLAEMTPEEFLSVQVGEILSDPGCDFERATQRVLEKNAELYRRLAGIQRFHLSSS